MRRSIYVFIFLLTFCFSTSAFAYNPYESTQKVWICPEFTFHTGETLKNLKLGYVELGNPKGETVVLLHGTGGSGAGIANSPVFGGALFGQGQALDASKYHIILIDAIGTGESSKPSDGLKASFPRYNYDDMITAQYRLLTEGLQINHVRAIIGFSMGGMNTWLWGIKYPNYMDAIVPMASSPCAMNGRNYITRKFISDSIRMDPAWQGGNYTEQPKSAQFATIYYNFATNLGTAQLAQKAPSYVEADEMVAKAFAAPYNVDANDILYQWEASTDFNPVGYQSIKADILVINSADDERNPIELGVCAKALKEIGHGTEILIPAGPDTNGHATTFNANLWKDAFAKFIKNVPHRSK